MDLKFDEEMSVDTSLAQKYIQNDATLNKWYNDIYIDNSTIKNEHLLNDLFNSSGEASTSGVLQDLAVPLKQNAKLIAQLEYLIRNIPIEDTNVQLDLIIRWLKYYNGTDIKDIYIYMSFRSNDSLIRLIPYFNTDSYVYVDEKTVFVCHLFLKLVYEARLPANNIIFKVVPDERAIVSDDLKNMESGTVAVVTEDADIDSAVDTLLATPIKVPWRLRRILVQESVYQVFKDALKGKCILKNSENKPTKYINALCAESLAYNNRVFLIDCMEILNDDISTVTVEAYRTTKEVMSILQKDETRYLSLWSSDIAEINEVSHNTSAPVVWVNNLGDFRGPVDIIKAIFGNVNDARTFPIRKTEDVSKIIKLSESWRKLDFESRRDILFDVLNKFKAAADLGRDCNQTFIKDMNDLLTNCTTKSFVDVGKDYVCVGVTKPRGIHYDSDTLTVRHMKSVLYGNALILFTPTCPVVESTLYHILESAGVPIIFIFGIEICDNTITCYPFYDDLYRTCRFKVIWTNSGKIFAN